MLICRPALVISCRPYIPKRLKDVRLRIAWFVGAVVGGKPFLARQPQDCTSAVGSGIGAWIASPGIQKEHVAEQLEGGWTGPPFGISGLESSTNSVYIYIRDFIRLLLPSLHNLFLGFDDVALFIIILLHRADAKFINTTVRPSHEMPCNLYLLLVPVRTCRLTRDAKAAAEA